MLTLVCYHIFHIPIIINLPTLKGLNMNSPRWNLGKAISKRSQPWRGWIVSAGILFGSYLIDGNAQVITQPNSTSINRKIVGLKNYMHVNCGPCWHSFVTTFSTLISQGVQDLSWEGVCENFGHRASHSPTQWHAKLGKIFGLKNYLHVNCGPCWHLFTITF
jgi:hypothetical protein